MSNLQIGNLICTVCRLARVRNTTICRASAHGMVATVVRARDSGCVRHRRDLTTLVSQQTSRNHGVIMRYDALDGRSREIIREIAHDNQGDRMRSYMRLCEIIKEITRYHTGDRARSPWRSPEITWEIIMEIARDYMGGHTGDRARSREI